MIFGSELQLGNGVQNGSLGSGSVSVQTGGTSPIFNRTDSVSAPYVASNVISGTIDFTMDFQSGATELKGSGANTKAKAIVRNGATLILSAAGTDLGAGTVFGGFGATNLIVETGGVCKLGVHNAAGRPPDGGGPLRVYGRHLRRKRCTVKPSAYLHGQRHPGQHRREQCRVHRSCRAVRIRPMAASGTEAKFTRGLA